MNCLALRGEYFFSRCQQDSGERPASAGSACRCQQPCRKA